MGTFATWLPDVLRGAGLTVVTSAGWETRGHYGGFVNLRAVVWHHDASATGDSPGVVPYMLRNWDSAAGGLWVDRYGVWTVLAAGPAYHAGSVLAGKPGNQDSFGVETDHTTGEGWPAAQIDSLRRGTAAILARLGTEPGSGLEFHRTICDPPNRKSDPDGLDLDAERARVSEFMHPAPPPISTTTGDDDVARLITEDGKALYGTDGVRVWHVPDPAILSALLTSGVYGDGRVTTVPAGTVASLNAAEK